MQSRFIIRKQKSMHAQQFDAKQSYKLAWRVCIVASTGRMSRRFSITEALSDIGRCSAGRTKPKVVRRSPDVLICAKRASLQPLCRP